MGNHVFISYSRKDQTYARKLADDLRKRGFEPWMDDRIDFGDRWWRTIDRKIRTCAAFVVVMTPDSEESEWVEREVQLALREVKPIFPLLLRGTGFSLLITIQHADVAGERLPPADFYERLGQVASARRVPEPKPTPPVRTAPHLAGLPAIEPEVVQPVVTERVRPFEPEMILIPAGEFLMGSDPRKDKDAQSDEQPQHTLYLPDYTMAKTPVTNAQYAKFVVDAGVVAPPGYWQKGEPTLDKLEHPVVSVSWSDAMNYCNWLADVTGKPYRLPSEAEWEKAARGTDGRIYPWSNTWYPGWCNTAERRPGDTTSIGAYPRGASPYGLLDMAGNVSEWTRSLWGKTGDMPDFEYPYDPQDGRENLGAGHEVLRVVRGGSFFGDRLLARCAFRGRGLPDVRAYNIGFRVVVSPILC